MLIPISAAAAPVPSKKLIPIDHVSLPLPPLIRLETAVTERTLPRLIPIGSDAAAATPKMPPLIQMGVEDFADDYIPTLEDFM